MAGRIGSLARDHRRGILGAATLLAVAVVVLVATRPWSTTTYDLHATGVWVVNHEARLYGRVNPELPELDHVAVQQAAQVHQDGDDVYLLVQTSAGSTVRRLLPEDPSAETPELRFDGEVFLQPGGGLVGAVHQGEVTRLRGDPVLTAEVLGEVSTEVAGRSRFAVGVDGTIAALEQDGGLFVAGPGDEELRPVGLDAVAEDMVSLTLVGDRPVVLDESGSVPRIVQPGRPAIELDDLVAGDRVDVSLQRPGPEASVVVVGTEDELAAVDLADGDVEVLAGDGVGGPFSPVVHDGCTYGAWRGGGDGAMVVLCDGEEPVRGDGLVLSGDAGLVTGSTTVLNDRESGQVHVEVDGRIVSITGWPEQEERDPDPIYDELERDPLAKEPPVAVPDVTADETGVGARPGRVTFLPVLRNDFDANGDILAVDEDTLDLSEVPEEHRDRFSVAQDGRSIAVDLTGWADGDPDGYTLSYRATDGDQLSEPAKVELEVVTAGGRDPQLQDPELPFELHVETGRRVTRDVLSAFWDYDGDPLYLSHAEVSGDGDHAVSWQSDGRLTFAAANEPADIDVTLEVRDVTGGSSEAVTLEVRVDTGDAQAPVLNNDVVTMVAGVDVTMDPLANDLAPDGRPLTVAGTPEVVRALDDRTGDLEIAPAGEGGFTFRSAEPGRYVAHYTVEEDDGPGATVLVRVLDEPPPPLVRPDVVVVEEGSSAEVDLLANDLTVPERMLSVTAVELVEDEVRIADADADADADGGTGPGSVDGATVEERLRDLVSAGAGADLRTFRADALAEARAGTVVTYRYEASTAEQSGRSTVTVVVEATEGNRPPVTRPVEGIAVRAGGAVTVPLDRFAYDPDLDPLEVAVPEDGQPADGDARPSGTSIRYFAPAEAPSGPVAVLVEVADPHHVRTTTLTFEVTTADVENEPPIARDVEARTRAGREVVIPIPLDFRDPDGDDVRIQGRVGVSPLDGDVELNPVDQTFVFNPRTDQAAVREQRFQYTLIDERGAESTPAEVKVLVTPEAEEGSPPVAAVDRVVARPDTVVFVDPVLNDSDLDREPVRLADALDRVEGAERFDQPVAVDSGRCEADVVDGRVRITTGPDGEVCRIAYGVTDADPDDDRPGAVVEGRILVTTIGGFPGVRPTARNDYPARGGRDATTVGLDVLANDEDLDGDPADLRVTLVDEDGEAVDERDGVRLEDDGTMTIDVDEEPRMVRYRITDADDLTADAVVRVPGLSENRPPELRPDRPAIVLRDGEESFTVDLDDHIVDPDGDEVTYTAAVPGQRFEVDDGASLADGEVVIRRTANLGGIGTLVVEAHDDRDARASLSLPVEIEGNNTEPQWVGQPCGPVSRGDDPETVQLRADDVDPGDTERLTFAIDGSASDAGVTIRLGGPRSSVLTIDPGDGPKGRRATFRLTVTDGKPRSEPVVEQCTVEVGESSKPPLTAADRTVVVDQGTEERFRLADLVTNAQGEVRLVPDPSVSPAAIGTVQGAGGALVFRAGVDAPPAGVITYTVADELDDASDRRRATGRISVTVRGRPDRPTNVQAVLVDDGAAVALQWTPGDDNGARATFEVRGGGATKQCATAACSVGRGDGLVLDGSGATFTVVARNDVGESEPSGPSNEVFPDTAPDRVRGASFAPISPQGGGTTRWGRVSWSPPAGGRDVDHYEVDGERVEGTTLDLSGVEDGQSVQIVAVNVAGDGRERRGPPVTAGPLSGSYGRPTVTSVAVEAVNEGERQAKVSWSVDANGGTLRSIDLSTPATCETPSAPVVTSGSASFTCGSANPGGAVSVVAVIGQGDGGGLRSEAQQSNPFPRLNQRPQSVQVTADPGYKALTVTVTVGPDDTLTRGTVRIDGTDHTLAISGRSGTVVLGEASPGDHQVTRVEVCSGTAASLCTTEAAGLPLSVYVVGDPPAPTGVEATRNATNGNVDVTFSCTAVGGRSLEVRVLRGETDTLMATKDVNCAGPQSVVVPRDMAGDDAGTLTLVMVDTAYRDQAVSEAAGPVSFDAHVPDDEEGDG